MARAQYFTRTFRTSRIFAATIEIKNGKPVMNDLEPFNVETSKHPTPQEAAQLAADYYSKDDSLKGAQFVVKEFDTEDVTYRLSVADFMKYAEVVPSAADIVNKAEADAKEAK